MSFSVDARYALNRRRLIAGFGALAAMGLPALNNAAVAQVRFAASPFTLGVAAGDPAPDGFVIWTRLAPDPLGISSGMPTNAVEVAWEIASDDAFTQVVRKGTAIARPELAHSVHVEVEGLAAQRPYFYRFIAGGQASPVGRASTTPALGAPVAAVRFGVVGCQHWEQGFFTGYRHLASEPVDFVFHYGDYIYEYHVKPRTLKDGTVVGPPRTHQGAEPYSLDEYRRCYAQYKMDPDLQAAHAASAWFHTWDDHEIEDNWTGEADHNHTPAEIWALRKAQAAQAFYEHMPLRASAFPRGGQIALYRRANWGTLAQLNFLDTRQYRTDQPCDDKYGSTCPGINDPKAQVIGLPQERWLTQGLTRSPARWNVLAQQIMMMDMERNAQHGINPDSWGGYRAPRNRLLSELAKAKVKNLIVLTGDEHKHYAGEVHLDGQRPGKTPIALEFVGSSISSSGDGSDTTSDTIQALKNNPGLKLANSQRGYLVCDVNRERWLTDVKVLDKVSTPGGALSSRAKIAVEAGSSRMSL